jgi:hypothetical protein
MLKSQTTKTLAISVMLFRVDNWAQRSRSTARNIRELAEKLSAIILSELYINKLFTPKLPYQVVKYFLLLILQNVYNICKGFRVQSVIIFYSYIYAYRGN